MEKIGFIIGETFLYWSPLILAVAAVCAACLFAGMHLAVGGKVAGTFLAIPVALAFSLVCSRLVYWYCSPESFASFAHAMTNYTTGGFALAGVFIGCGLAAVLTWMVSATDNLPRMLDCMAVAGALGICVGRMNHLFNGFDRGMVVTSIQELPLVYPVENTVSGLHEYRLATFMVQAVVAGALFLGLAAFYIQSVIRKTRKDGDTFLLFLLFYGASQIVMDSTRYDSLFLRSNGFISMVMILGAVLLVSAVVVFSVRLVRNRGFKWWYLAFWVGIVGLLAGAGVMEYFVQRRGNEAAFFYNIMTACLVCAILVTLAIRLLAMWEKKPQEAKTE